MIDNPKWLTIAKVVEKIKSETGVELSKSTVRRWVDEGGLITGRLGARLVIREDTVPTVEDIIDNTDSRGAGDLRQAFVDYRKTRRGK